MGTKTTRAYMCPPPSYSCEKRIPKHGDENQLVQDTLITSFSGEKRIPKHGDENNFNRGAQR